MAIAFALLNSRVASVLFGATSAEQVSENVKAVKLVAGLDSETIAALQRIGAEGELLGYWSGPGPGQG